VPAVTHQRAGFGVLRVEKMVRDHERFAKIRPRFCNDQGCNGQGPRIELILTTPHGDCKDGKDYDQHADALEDGQAYGLQTEERFFRVPRSSAHNVLFLTLSLKDYRAGRIDDQFKKDRYAPASG